MIEIASGQNYQKRLKRSRYVDHDEKLSHPVKCYTSKTVFRSLEKCNFNFKCYQICHLQVGISLSVKVKIDLKAFLQIIAMYFEA